MTKRLKVETENELFHFNFGQNVRLSLKEFNLLIEERLKHIKQYDDVEINFWVSSEEAIAFVDLIHTRAETDAEVSERCRVEAEEQQAKDAHEKQEYERLRKKFEETDQCS